MSDTVDIPLPTETDNLLNIRDVDAPPVPVPAPAVDMNAGGNAILDMMDVNPTPVNMGAPAPVDFGTTVSQHLTTHEHPHHQQQQHPMASLQHQTIQVQGQSLQLPEPAKAGEDQNEPYGMPQQQQQQAPPPPAAPPIQVSNSEPQDQSQQQDMQPTPHAGELVAAAASVAISALNASFDTGAGASTNLEPEGTATTATLEPEGTATTATLEQKGAANLEQGGTANKEEPAVSPPKEVPTATPVNESTNNDQEESEKKRPAAAVSEDVSTEDSPADKKLKTNDGTAVAAPPPDSAAADTETADGDENDAAENATDDPDKKKPGRKPGSLNKKRSISNYNASWNDMFFALMAFKAKLGTFHVPNNTKLGKWVTKQRQEYSKLQRRKITYHQCHELSEERIQVLNSLGFIWDTMLHENGRRWNQRFEELKKWKEENGHCNVPQSTSLGQWVKIQRENKREADLKAAGRLPTRTKPKPCLAPDRIEKLTSIGFQWRVAAPVTGWDNRYNQLLEYAKIHHGDVNVPQYYPQDKAFGRWVMKQRSEYSLRLRGLKSQLTDERVEKLNTIGFSWVAPNFKRKVTVGIAKGSPAASIAAAIHHLDPAQEINEADKLDPEGNKNLRAETNDVVHNENDNPAGAMPQPVLVEAAAQAPHAPPPHAPAPPPQQPQQHHEVQPQPQMHQPPQQPMPQQPPPLQQQQRQPQDPPPLGAQAQQQPVHPSAPQIVHHHHHHVPPLGAPGDGFNPLHHDHHQHSHPMHHDHNPYQMNPHQVPNQPHPMHPHHHHHPQQHNGMDEDVMEFL